MKGERIQSRAKQTLLLHPEVMHLETPAPFGQELLTFIN